MNDTRISELLRANPRASKHEESIRRALEDVRKLREAGLTSSKPVIPTPYRGRAAAGEVTKKTFKTLRMSASTIVFT